MPVPVVRPGGRHDWINSYSTSWWSLLLINRSRGDEMLSWPYWLTYCTADVWPTKWSPVQLAVRRRTGKVRRSKTSVLPLCYAANSNYCPLFFSRPPNRRSLVMCLRLVIVMHVNRCDASKTAKNDGVISVLQHVTNTDVLPRSCSQWM